MTLPTKKIPELVELVTPGEADVLAVEDLALLRTSKITVANLRASMTAGYATTAYVDAVVQGLSIKASVRVATVGAGSYEAGQTVDGVVLAAGDRVLVKNGDFPQEFGIYVVQASGPPVRAEDFDENADVTTGAYCFVQEGTTNGDSGWVLTTDNPIVVGTTGLAFAQFSGAGQIEVGDGLTKTGNLISLDPADGSIVTSPSGVSVGVINFDQHGAQTEPSLHAVASGVANGFMSSADKVALDAHLASTANPHGTSIANLGSGTLAQLNAALSDGDVVPTTRTVTAGAGLTGGGALSGNITLNAVAHADGSIVVAADSIQVGALATDAQHGVRGGGTQHADATNVTSGFMSAADKVKLTGIATGAVADHGALTGLSDDDHAQYLLANGTRALSGNLAVNALVTIDGRDISVDGAALDAHLASTSNPHATSIANIGGGTLAQLNAAVTDADLVPTTRTVTAGAGMTGGGALSANITLNVVAHADGSILVAADSVQVGVLATDAQHGNRGNGSLHTVATTLAAGFMSAADKTKLDGIATGAVADHGALTGLADDDHAQYLLVSGTRAMTGGLKTIAGSAGSNALYPTGFAGTGISFGSASVNFATSSAYRWSIDSSALIGFGSPIILANDIDATLSVIGSANVTLNPSVQISNTHDFEGTSEQFGVQLYHSITQDTGLDGGFTSLQLFRKENSLGKGNQRFIEGVSDLSGTVFYVDKNGLIVTVSGVSAAGSVSAGGGSSTLPGHTFAGAAGAGMYYTSGSTLLGFAVASTAVLTLEADRITFVQPTQGLPIETTSSTTTPAAGDMNLIGYDDVASNAHLRTRNQYGRYTAYGAAEWSKNIQIVKGGSTTFTTHGINITTAGTIAKNDGWVTDRRSAMKSTLLSSTAAAGTSGTVYTGTCAGTSSGTAGLGGFFFHARFGWATIPASSRFFIGLYGNTVAIGNVQPSTLFWTVGVAKDTTDTNLQIMHNDGAGAATKVNLTSIGAPQTTEYYDFYLHDPSDGTGNMYWTVTRSDGLSQSGTISSNHPSPGILTGMYAWFNNGATASIVTGALSQMYLESEN